MSLLMQLEFEGSDGSTSFTDSTGTNNPVTGYNNAEITTDDYKVGSSCLDASSGSNHDYAYVITGSFLSSWNPYGSYTTDFTFDFWFKKLSATTSTDYMFHCEASNNYRADYLVCYNHRGKPIFTAYKEGRPNHSTSILEACSNTAVIDEQNEWYRWVIVKKGSDTGIYIGKNSTTLTQVAYGSMSDVNKGTPLKFETAYSTGYWGTGGYLDEFKAYTHNYYDASPNSSLTDVIYLSYKEGPLPLFNPTT